MTKKKIKPDYYICSLSGGKDSTAMLITLLEHGRPIDEIIFSDTLAEFPQMYEHLDKVEKVLGVKITRIKPKESYEELMFDHLKTKGKNIGQRGFGWSSMLCRWCTEHLKVAPQRKYLKELRKKYTIHTYIGYAVDEPKRYIKAQIVNGIYPLVEYNMTEEDCLKLCYERGFDWEGLYEWNSRTGVLAMPCYGYSKT